jgi:DNA invertase Pin-like site-specific DNA recombinase
MKKVSKGKKKGLLIMRVSTLEQAKKGASLQSQEDWGKKMATSMGVQIVEEIKVNISGDVFLKKYYEQISKIVTEKEIDHLFVYDLDRLSRNLPWGSWVLEDLWSKGVQLVTRTLIPDLSASPDRISTWVPLLVSEIEFGGIHEKTSRGILTKLSRGEYFYENLPFGYERADLKIFLKNEYKPIIQFIFITFLQKKSYTETARIVNNQYKQIIGYELKAQAIKKIIINKICIGYFTWSGNVLGVDGDETKPREELIAIDTDTFEKAQQIAITLGKKYSKNDTSHLTPLLKWIDEYGPAFILDSCKNLIVACPKCRSIRLVCDGTEIYSGALVSKYRCKNNKCKHEFRFPSGSQLQTIRKLTPRRCMKCGVPDHFEISDSPVTDYYKLICLECENEVLVRKDDIAFQLFKKVQKKIKHMPRKKRIKKTNRCEKSLVSWAHEN